MVQRFTLTLFFVAWIPAVFGLTAEDLQTMNTLKHEATLHGLNGNFGAANLVSDQLQRSFPEDGIGYTVSLNTLATLLSWDGKETVYDKTFKNDAARTLDLCRAKIKTNPETYRNHYQCGQAYFALTYLHALRGNYYRSGTSGTKAIEHLERALALNPELIDAKMHLGVAYYYADNLPPFVKAFSKLLWFIPTGNSNKSLPYIQEVVAKGEYFSEVAKYIYANLLIDGDDDDRLQATTLLRGLVDSYPHNKRFALRYISLLMERDLHLQALQAADEFISSKDQFNRDIADIDLAQLWVSRAYLQLGSTEKAISEFEVIDQSSSISSFPGWARSWFELTRAQINDLQNQRAEAISAYKDAIKLHGKYGNEEILAMAEEGLKKPYKLGN